MAKTKKTEQEAPLECKLWAAAGKLRTNMDAAANQQVVLRLVLLRYISDAFEDLFEQLKEVKGNSRVLAGDGVNAVQGLVYLEGGFK
jgi:type I restriction enzyme M protein